MLLLRNLITTFGGMHPLWLALCGLALLIVAGVCSLAFGSCRHTAALDLLVALLAEVTVTIVASSPLDFFHLRGEPLSQWSIALSTLLAAVGIVLNHRAEEG